MISQAPQPDFKIISVSIFPRYSLGVCYWAQRCAPTQEWLTDRGTLTCATVNTLAWLDGEVWCDMTVMEKRCGTPVHGSKDKDDLGELVNVAWCTPLHPCCLSSSTQCLLPTKFVPLSLPELFLWTEWLVSYRWDDTRGCIVQFWPPDDEHMCSKYVQPWNKLIIKFSASSWLILR
jgi:hypothetical protein